MSLIFIPQYNEIEVFESCYKTQTPLLIKGPTGCGKSQLVEYMAQKLSRPLIKVACNEDTNAADLLGRFLLKGAETIWQDGPVTRAVKTNAILYLDEIAEAREDVLVAIHPLADHRREIYLDKINQTLSAEKDFMLVASFNPGYQQGLKELKPSTRQRFVSMAMNYLPLEKEVELLISLTGIEATTAQAICKLAQKIRPMKDLNLKETVSTRLLVNTAKLIKTGMNKRLAAHVAMAGSLTDDEEIYSALQDIINLSL